jgi:outer membrane protein OmpA-like peptidoglycan-associated protein
MKKFHSTAIIALFFIAATTSNAFSLKPVNDSLNPFTEKELLKLSKVIYALEKKDSLASLTEPNGFDLKSKLAISDKKLLVDLINDSIHYYSGKELIALSNYIFELEKKDSIRRVKDSLRALKPIIDSTKKVEFHMDEEKELRNFESAIFFTFNSSSLTPESYKALDDIVAILKTYINLNFIIEGYTDNSGSNSYNKVLSIRRAKVVREYFISKGIEEKRVISVVGMGGNSFLYPNDSEENKAKNRNVIIKAYH